MKKSTQLTCNFCQSKSTKNFKKHNHVFLKCSSCQTISMKQNPSQEQIINHYKNKIICGNYELVQRYKKQYNLIYKQFLEIIENHTDKVGKNLKLLDIGCFTGEFLFLAHEQGYDVTGYEIQDDAVNLANQKLPGRIHKIDLLNEILDNKKHEKFDVITMLGLIEHVLQPVKLLNKIKFLLKEGGYLIIQTPNTGSLMSKIMGKYWPPISPVEHINLFSQSFLSDLLKKDQLKIVKSYNHIKYLPIDYVYSNLDNFGSDIKFLINPIYKIIPNFIRKKRFPFMVGEMILVFKYN